MAWRSQTRPQLACVVPFASIYHSAKGIKSIYPSAWTKFPVLVPEDHHIFSAYECKLPADGPQSISWIWLFLSWLDNAWERQCMVERAASQERWKQPLSPRAPEEVHQSCETKDSHYHCIHSMGEGKGSLRAKL